MGDKTSKPVHDGTCDECHDGESDLSCCTNCDGLFCAECCLIWESDIGDSGSICRDCNEKLRADLTHLQFRRGEIRHPHDVARLRGVLSDAGYTARDHDIQDAYSVASEDEYAASWMATDAMADDELLVMLLSKLEPIPEGGK